MKSINIMGRVSATVARTFRPRFSSASIRQYTPKAARKDADSIRRSNASFNLQAMSARDLGLPPKHGSTPTFSATLASSFKNPGPAQIQDTLAADAWNVNREQNALSEISVNPADIDPSKQRNVLEEEAQLIAENKKYTSPYFQQRERKLKVLAENFAFPLKPDQLYTPYDLTIEAWRKRNQVRFAAYGEAQDPFDRIGVDPFWEYKNYQLLSNFVSSMGRILPMNRTGCSSKNQRRLSKAIRRARALGFMPIWSRHPQQRIIGTFTDASDAHVSTQKNDPFSGGSAYADKVEGSDFLARN